MKTNYDDLIILYLDNRMTEEAKREFEKELKRSPELTQRYIRLKSNLEAFNSVSPAETDSDYFSNMVPRFRQRLERKSTKRKYVPGYALYTAGAAAVLIIAFIFLFSRNTAENGIDELKSLDYTEAGEVLSSYMYSDDFAEMAFESGEGISDKIDSIFTHQYLLADGGENYLEYNSVISSLTDEEADFLYSQLINKDIISGEL